ncbi:hypothetical protein CTRU02_212336 [Colletotrichum truncatum]|uniref:Uncharacterized protein n=1 Tax=Colletotrichum truncatum TaxID=5467 RepID=A0ACC3YN98_COLTU
MGERTGSRVFQWVWSYVVISILSSVYIRWQHRVQAERRKRLP